MKHIALAALLAGVVTDVGGWAVVTVSDLPPAYVAGDSVTFEFTVRQHGAELRSDLSPKVRLTTRRPFLGLGGEPVIATHGTAPGTYVVRFKVPDAESLFISIKTGIGMGMASFMPFLPQPITPNATLGVNPAEYGRRLFVAKGCVTCHVRDGAGVESEVGGAGPELSGRSFPREYLAAFLENPSIKPRTNRYQSMPNLGLKGTEIAALVSYINSERAMSSR